MILNILLFLYLYGITAISVFFRGFASVATQLRFTGPVVLVVPSVEVPVTSCVVDTAAVVVRGLLVVAVVAVVAPGTSPWMVSSRMLQDVWQTTWRQTWNVSVYIYHISIGNTISIVYVYNIYNMHTYIYTYTLHTYIYILIPRSCCGNLNHEPLV